MNQRGDVTLISLLMILALSGLVTICTQELKRAHKNLDNRIHLLLCIKETKGELHQYLKFMGRTNWAIKNIQKAALIALFIPGLQGVAGAADKAKKTLMASQDIRLLGYLKALAKLKKKSCSLEPRLFLTPFEIGPIGHKRELNSMARIRENEWTYYFWQKPYAMGLKVRAQGYLGLHPNLKYEIEESKVTSSFL